MDLGGLLSVNKKNVGDDLGVVYVLDIRFEEEGHLTKIGITSKARDPQFRWNQISNSIWKQYRYMPWIYPKRFKQTEDIHNKEKILLDYFSEYQKSPAKKVDGSTEMFQIDVQLVADIYDMLLKGKELPRSDVYCKECGREAKFDGKCAWKCGESTETT